MGKSKGLGDDVEKVIKFIGLDKLVKKDGECSPCQRRKKILNDLVPYEKPPIKLIPNNGDIVTGKYTFEKDSIILIDGKNIKYSKGDEIFITKDNNNINIFNHLYKLGVLKKYV